MLLLLFELGPERYALAAGRVVEVLPLVRLTPIPQAPRGVAGLFNYHGQPVPVVDLGELLGLAPAPARLTTRIIVVRHPDGAGAERWLGLMVGGTTRTLRCEPEKLRTPGAVGGSCRFWGRCWRRRGV